MSPSTESGGDNSRKEDNSKVCQDLPIFPSEDVRLYGELIKRIATRLGIPYMEVRSKVGDVIFGIIQRDVSAPIWLPMTSVLLNTVQQI